MSKILIGEKIYDVKLNKMFIQPHLIINGITTDIGIWDNTNVDELDELLLKAVKCYEFNKKKNTLNEYNNFHIHNSEKITELTLKTKKWWWF